VTAIYVAVTFFIANAGGQIHGAGVGGAVILRCPVLQSGSLSLLVKVFFYLNIKMLFITVFVTDICYIDGNKRIAEAMIPGNSRT